MTDTHAPMPGREEIEAMLVRQRRIAEAADRAAARLHTQARIRGDVPLESPVADWPGAL